MRLIVCFCLLFATIYSSPVIYSRRFVSESLDDEIRSHLMPVLKEDGSIEFIDIENVTITLTAELSDVTYYLYTRSNRNNPYIITDGDINQVKNSPFASNKLSVFISHGWNNDYTSPVNADITAAILDTYDMNVFVVDWHGPANSNYLTARNAVPTIGQFEGEFISRIQATYDLFGDSFVLIGHSLGAHVAGCAGATLNRKPTTIVGLDPAGPLFTSGNIENRIDPTDGEFVQIIHTDTSLLGFGRSIGDADYYPNGGSRQPGCGLDLIGTCAHGRSYEYLAESVRRSNAFYARRCDSYDDYEEHKCDNNKGSPMGGIYVDRTAKGDYYLNTNSESPYGMS